MGAFGRKLLWGSRKVTEAAAFHQDGGRYTAHRAEDHAKMWAGFYLKCCCPTAPLQPGGPAPLTGMDGTANMQTVCSMAGWISEETIHPGPAARGCGPRAPGAGAVPTADTSLLALEGLMSLHRYLQAANKVICSSSCSLSTDGGTPRAEDYFWLAISDCSCLSQPR